MSPKKRLHDQFSLKYVPHRVSSGFSVRHTLPTELRGQKKRKEKKLSNKKQNVQKLNLQGKHPHVQIMRYLVK